MKTENTLENKARFFALYTGQKIFYSEHHGGAFELSNYEPTTLWKDETIYVKLTPLSSITDEDAIEVSNLLVNGYEIGCEPHTLDNGLDFISRFKYNDGKENFYSAIEWSNAIDLLRSKGYALPFLDLSVSDLIEYGWIKLTP